MLYAHKTPVCRIFIEIHKDSAFTGSNIGKQFSYQQFNLRQMRILRRGQPIVDFNAADKYCLYVTTMKVVSFQDDIPSIPIDKFKDH